VAVKKGWPNWPPHLDDRGYRRHREDGRVKAEAEARARTVKLSNAADNGAAVAHSSDEHVGALLP
jgi:hypothetical protein